MKTQKLWIDFAKQVGSNGPSKIIFQRRFVVIVYPMQARRVCTLGNCRCRKCSDIHTGCPKWDQNIVSYILLFHRLVVVVVWVLSIFLAVPIILTKVLGIAIANDKKHINTYIPWWISKMTIILTKVLFMLIIKISRLQKRW